MTDFDPINKPSHYNQSDIECIDAIRAALGEDGFRAFCRGTVIKYAWRADHKGATAQDLGKMAWYARMAAGDDPREYRNQKLAGWPAQRQVPICKLCGLPANSTVACYNERCPG